MKTFLGFIFFVLFLGPLWTNSQNYDWTPAVPITDSMTDNQNAIVIDLDFFGGWDYYIIWEKSPDSASTQIYSMSYYALEEPVALTEGDYHHTDPAILKPYWSYPPETTDFYLFYLSDEDGDFDLYYKVYSDGSFSDPVQFINTPGNETHLRSNSSSGLTWEYEGKIMYAGLRKDGGGPYYFTEIITVDSIACLNPVLEVIGDGWSGENFLAYEKVLGDSSKVMLSQWSYALDEWAEPELIYDSGHCTNLRFEESSYSQVATTLSWDMTDAAGHRKVILYDPYYGDFMQMDPNPLNAYDPSVFNIFVGVKEIWFYALLTFVLEENGQTDIYGGEQTLWEYADFKNLSASSAVERNPQLWNGYMYYYYQNVLNIWESYRNGHWQLWTSRIDVPIAGSVDETGSDDQGRLRVFPNPFRDHINIYYNSDKEGAGQLFLYDHLGRNMGELAKVLILQGENTWKVEVAAKTYEDIPGGMYFIKLVTNDYIITQKIMKIQ